MIERRTLRSHEEADLRHNWAIANSHLHRRLVAAGVVGLVSCMLLLGASPAAAAVVPLGQPYLDELWSEFPLDPDSQRDTASTETSPAGSSTQDEKAVQAASRSDESKPAGGRDSDSDALPLPLPVLLVLSLGAAILLWLLAVAPEGTFRRARRSTLPSVVPSVQAALGHGDAVRSATSIAPQVEAPSRDGHAPPEEKTDDGSAAPVPTSDSRGSDRLVWLRAEVESARRDHDVLSLLLVRSDQRAGAGPGGDVVRTVASAIEEALHDVPHKLRRDGELVSVVLPHTLAEGAKRLAARMPLFLTEAMPEPRTHVSLRIGVACFPRDAGTVEELLEICERELRLDRAGRSAGG